MSNRHLKSEMGTVVVFQKTTIIGEAVIGEGDDDVMSLFFAAVENDSRDQMSAEATSTDDYQMVDPLGTTKITVTHEPHQTVLSPAEQRRADREARKAQKSEPDAWHTDESIS